MCEAETGWGGTQSVMSGHASLSLCNSLAPEFYQQFSICIIYRFKLF